MTRCFHLVLAAAVSAAAALSAASAAADPATAYNLYFGDLHTHTRFSDGWEGTPGDAFRAAAAAGADYMATTDHNFLLTQEEWAQTLRFADRYTSHSFAALAGSEYWITSGFGEVIVYNMTGVRRKANFHDPRVPLSRAEVIGAFYDWLASNNAIGYWPHPGLYGDQDDFDHWTPFRDQAMSLIEIHNYGSWLGAPARWGVHNYERAYLTALDKGWHVMPAASSDTHAPNWIGGYPVRTVLLARERTPEAMLDAMRSRRGYATLDENLRISYSLNNEVMGSRLATPSAAGPMSVSRIPTRRRQMRSRWWSSWPTAVWCWQACLRRARS